MVDRANDEEEDGAFLSIACVTHAHAHVVTQTRLRDAPDPASNVGLVS